VFLPTLVFAIGEGAIIPIIPVVASNLGASLAIAGFIAGMILVGEVLGDIPSGWVVSHIGERSAMIYASFLSVVGLIKALLAPNPWLRSFGIFLVGLATAVFSLARHAFMTTFVPLAYRARALSTLGGTFRFGYFIGPFLSAAAIHLTGTSQSAFWIHILACLSAAAILLLLPDPSATFGKVATRLRQPGPADAQASPKSQGLFPTMWTSRGVLVKLGSGAMLIGALRASRQVVLPLWAVSIGISDTNTALIIGVAGTVDFALFYASGQIMDRFGRMWTSAPSMIGLGVGHLALALTHDVPGRVAWFIGIAIVLSMANGIGSGILMTLGADLADPLNPAPFLGAWRFTSDAGGAAAPLVVSLVTGVASLAIACGIMGVFGLLGAGILARYIPRYIPWHRPRDAGPTLRPDGPRDL
jgi:MFS family permease